MRESENQEQKGDPQGYNVMLGDKYIKFWINVNGDRNISALLVDSANEMFSM